MASKLNEFVKTISGLLCIFNKIAIIIIWDISNDSRES